MGTAILSCSTLKDYAEAAQKKENTDYPVILLDRKYHSEPKTMQQKIVEAVADLPDSVDTVLVAMGFCGGSWDHVTFSRRVVIPRVDDCITLLLQKGDDYAPNLKAVGHMYMVETNPDDFDMSKLLNGLPEGLEDFDEEELFEMFFGKYRYLDVVDTGLTDCYSEEYVRKAQKNADLMDVALDYVDGSNRMLEKLMAGKWDAQFLVAEPGHLIRHGDFF